MSLSNAATTCGAHIPVPSTNATACDHRPTGMHGAHHPNGSPGAGGLPTAASSPPRHHDRVPWSNARPRSRRYGYEHQRTRAAHIAALERAGAGLCAERVCIHRTRLITPDMDLDLAHDPTGTVVLGLAHRACNRHEAAVRARRMQGRRSATPRRSPLRW